jgi:hypothetical protein
MPKSTTFANNIVDLVLNAVAIADIAENDTSSPLTNTYLALYTGTLTTTDNPTTNEATYGGYARIAMSRAAFAAWTAAALGISEIVADAIFPTCTAGSDLITCVKLVTTPSGAGKVLYAGQLISDRTIIVDRIPRFVAGTLKVKES